MESEKDFDVWNINKKETELTNDIPLFYEREIWWCKIGINIGTEIDGKHELFLRPVIVARKFNKEMALVVPTTTQDKNNKYFLIVGSEEGKEFNACLSQLRTISTKRLFRKIATVNESDYQLLLEKLSKMILGLLNNETPLLSGESRRPKPIIT